MESYSFQKLDLSKPEDKTFVEDAWAWDKPITIGDKVGLFIPKRKAAQTDIAILGVRARRRKGVQVNVSPKVHLGQKGHIRAGGLGDMVSVS